MSTRSRIAVANPDGTFTSIYCHCDGHPSGVGQTLRDHYKDSTKVAELIALGGLFSLGAEIGTKHSFDNASDGECNAYGRDRGEEGEEAVISKDFEALTYLTQDCGGEYLCVFKGDQWFCAEDGISFLGMPADKAAFGVNTPHKNAEAIKAFADGKQLQYQLQNRSAPDDGWCDFDLDDEVSGFGPWFDQPSCEWRVKPEAGD